MKISDDILQQLRERVSLTEVISSRVALTKTGAESIGLCPFHHEKTPSFTVSEAKGFFHCFGCGAHGSAIDFVMNFDNVSFRDAVTMLAATVGLSIEYSDKMEDRDRDRAQLRLLQSATEFFQATLRGSEGKRALAYLEARSISSEMMSLYRLGFAPNSYSRLRDGLLEKGYSEKSLVAAGLCVASKKSNQAYDRFRGRVMFPIFDEARNIIGFGGRVLDDGEPKYLNSPESDIFKKSEILYHIHSEGRRKEAENSAKELIIAEGYFDVISITQSTRFEAISPMGTALSKEQLRKAWRIHREPTVCFDGDASGQRAAVRCLEKALPLLKPGYGLKFATLPASDDPDSFIRRHGEEAFTKLISNALPISFFLWRQELDKTPVISAESRVTVWKNLCDRLKAIEDNAVRSEIRNMYYQSLWPKRENTRRHRHVKIDISSKKNRNNNNKILTDAKKSGEENILIILIKYFKFFNCIEKDFCNLSFRHDPHEHLRQKIIFIWSNFGSDCETLREKLLHFFNDSHLDYTNISSRLEFGGIDLTEETFKRKWSETLAAYKMARDIDRENRPPIIRGYGERFSRPYRMIREMADNEEQ